MKIIQDKKKKEMKLPLHLNSKRKWGRNSYEYLGKKFQVDGKASAGALSQEAAGQVWETPEVRAAEV